MQWAVVQRLQHSGCHIANCDNGTTAFLARTHTGRKGEAQWLASMRGGDGQKNDLFHISVTHATRFRFVTPTSTFGMAWPHHHPSPPSVFLGCRSGHVNVDNFTLSEGPTSIGLEEGCGDKGRATGAFGCQTPGEGFSMSFDTRSIAISVCRCEGRRKNVQNLMSNLKIIL